MHGHDRDSSAHFHIAQVDQSLDSQFIRSIRSPIFIFLFVGPYLRAMEKTEVPFELVQFNGFTFQSYFNTSTTFTQQDN
jgi:hypothetical protein